MKYPKMSQAAKRRASERAREKGKFTAATIKTTADIGGDAMLPPEADVRYSSMFIGIPNPVNDLFYNPDQAFLSNPENASRMIQDMAIYSALQERQLATCGLPWQIVPQDEDDPEQEAAADALEDLIRSHLKNIPDFLRNCLDAIWFGRSAAYLDYQWKFPRGKRKLAACGWTPVHGDTLAFASDGRLGYRVGVTKGDEGRDVIVGVPGRTIMVDEEPIIDGVRYLQPARRKAWVVHHYQRTAGEFGIFTSAASIYGLGLRSRVYPIWLIKQSTLEFVMNAAEKFGSGWLVGFFDGSNPASQTAVRSALQKQVGSNVMLFPRFAPEADAIEGVDVINPPSGFDGLKSVVDYFDKQLRMTICSESLTADNDKGTGLGSNVADVQESTFGRLIKYDSYNLAETLTDQLVGVLQEFNGYGHLPPLRFEFSFDIGTTRQKLDNAKLLYDMGIKVEPTELIKACGFQVPKEEELAQGEMIDTTNLEATDEIDTSEMDDGGPKVATESPEFQPGGMTDDGPRKPGST